MKQFMVCHQMRRLTTIIQVRCRLTLPCRSGLCMSAQAAWLERNFQNGWSGVAVMQVRCRLTMDECSINIKNLTEHTTKRRNLKFWSLVQEDNPCLLYSALMYSIPPLCDFCTEINTQSWCSPKCDLCGYIWMVKDLRLGPKTQPLFQTRICTTLYTIL